MQRVKLAQTDQGKHVLLLAAYQKQLTENSKLEQSCATCLAPFPRLTSVGCFLFEF